MLRLKRLLAPYSSVIEVIGEATSGQQAVALIDQMQPQLLFLDIHLPDMTGFEVLQQLAYRPLVIFSTAYDEYAVEAFESLSIDYLVKPYSVDRFAKMIHKLQSFTKPASHWSIQELSHSFPPPQPPPPSFALPIKQGDRILLIEHEKMAFIKADQKYSIVHTQKGQQHLCDHSLVKLEQQLPPSFIRVHRSYIVNRQHINELRKFFKGKYVLLINDVHQTKITTGETYAAKVKEWFGV